MIGLITTLSLGFAAVFDGKAKVEGPRGEKYPRLALDWRIEKDTSHSSEPESWVGAYETPDGRLRIRAVMDLPHMGYVLEPYHQSPDGKYWYAFARIMSPPPLSNSLYSEQPEGIKARIEEIAWMLVHHDKAWARFEAGPERQFMKMVDEYWLSWNELFEGHWALKAVSVMGVVSLRIDNHYTITAYVPYNERPIRGHYEGDPDIVRQLIEMIVDSAWGRKQ